MSIRVRYPTCGPILIGGENNTDIRVWLRGKSPKTKTTKIKSPKTKTNKIKTTKIKTTKTKTNKIKKYNRVIGIVQFNDTTEIRDLSEDNDWICMLEFSDITIDQTYEYRAGYYYLSNTDDDYDLDWTDSFKGKVNLHLDKPLSFVVGSCRKLINIGPINLFGTGNEGDIIYQSIKELNPDLFLSIGDQVYFDSMGNINRCVSLKSMTKLYRKTYNFEHHKRLCSSVPVYRTPDDHDRHMNNCNLITRERDPIGFANAGRAYQLYQHHYGPAYNRNEPIWRDVNIDKYNNRNTSFFIMDCRSDRNDINHMDSLYDNSTMISSRQFNDFRNWINSFKNSTDCDIVKFVVTSVPLLSQDTADSWYGFSLQQKEIIDLILSSKNIFVLTGDAHCCRSAIYSIYNNNDDYLGDITEILSSGLVAINHDRGKPFDVDVVSEDYIRNYDNDNDFPLIVDNTLNKGYKFRTIYATPCYPQPNKATGINFIKQLFHRVIDNTFTKVQVLDNYILVEIYNQNKRLLHTQKYDLQ